MKKQNILKAFLMAAVLAGSLCTSVGAEELCGKKELILVRQWPLGSTLSHSSVFDQNGEYLCSITDEHYELPAVTTIPENTVEVEYGEEQTVVHILKDYGRPVVLDQIYANVRQVGNLLFCMADNLESSSAVYTLEGEKIYQFPDHTADSGDFYTDLFQVVYKKHGRDYDYYFAVINHWIDEMTVREGQLIDEKGKVIMTVKDNDLAEMLYSFGLAYADGIWYKDDWENILTYDEQGKQTGTCSKEEYRVRTGLGKVNYEDPREEWRYQLFETETVIEDTGKARHVVVTDPDSYYLTHKILRKDGTELAEATDNDTKLTLRNDYYISSYCDYEQYPAYFESTVYNLDGEVQKYFPNAKVGGWVKQQYLTMEHGSYRGLVDLEGNWVLKVLCQDE